MEKTGDPSSGYIFKYEAVRPGETIILKRITKKGKDGDKTETYRFRVQVLDLKSTPEVTIKELKENIDRYKDRFIKLSGISRGWGRTNKASEVWGTMLTRSDWILEDDTGAVYISGMPQAERGKFLTLVCKVLASSNHKWALMCYKKLNTNCCTETEHIAKHINSFAFDLYQRLVHEDRGFKNIFFSPLSISYALAMTYAGARGNTRKQMAKTLHFTLHDDELHPAFYHLLQALISKPNSLYKLNIANALWGQKNSHFLHEFKVLIAKFYHGSFYEVDFIRKTEETRQKINEWIQQKTENKIKNLIARGDIDRLTRLVLTNAIYFKGTWLFQFEENNTRILPFYIRAMTSVNVPMMYQSGQFPYFKDEFFQILELPYSGDDLSMIIVLPHKNSDLKAIENSLTVKKFTFWLSRMRKQEVEVYLPKFKIKSKYYLSKVLSEMGMPDAFSKKADFSGITGNKELYISKIMHQAYINVDEEGTEASAATSVVMRLKSISLKPIFKADRPFLFFIVHKTTGSILFMGKIVNPTEKQ